MRIIVVVVIVLTTGNFRGSDALASQCSPAWELPLPYQLTEPDVARRLGPELSAQFDTFRVDAQWQMVMSGAHIIIEATPVHMVQLKEPSRVVITFRDVVWLRDLRRGALRPSTISLGVEFFGESRPVVIKREFIVPFDRELSLLPADPTRRYTFLLRLSKLARLKKFDNALTTRPIADLGDPTNGCTDAFIIESGPHTATELRTQELIHSEGIDLVRARGLETLKRLRQRPDLH